MGHLRCSDSPGLEVGLRDLARRRRRRRSDRVELQSAAAQESENSATSDDVRYCAAIGGQADIRRAVLALLSALTHQHGAARTFG